MTQYQGRLLYSPQGLFRNVESPKRGQVIDYDDPIDLERDILCGMVTDDLTTAVEDLPQAFGPTDRQPSAELLERQRNVVPEEYRLRPETLVRSPYHRLHAFHPANQGWQK